MMSTSPLPDQAMTRRTGVIDQADPVGSFDELGLRTRDYLVGLQPPGWFEGKRILDFGCGSGKVLRHLRAEAQRCEIWGCDIHEPSIRWIEENLDPALHVFACGEAPPLELPDEHVDLVWAMSVFTHLTDWWADWLLEIHRVMKPGGRFVATYLGEGMSEPIAHEHWNPDRIGMNVLGAWQDWDRGGPSVQLSEWWIQAHWGKLFEVENVQDGTPHAHGVLILRKRDVTVAREELRTPSDDPREWAALRHNVEQLQAESARLAAEVDALNVYRGSLEHDHVALVQSHRELEVELNRVNGQMTSVHASRSWRLTAPVRALAARLRA